MATAASPAWNRWDLLASPAFVTLAPLIEQLRDDHFPTLAQLNRMGDEREVLSGGGVPVEFVPQEAKIDEPYETRVYVRGKVLTRSRNWRDLFNALVWITFPRSKAAINRRHYREMLARQGEGLRGTPRAKGGSLGAPHDVLTLFDESGVIVASSEPELGALLRDFKWKELFWQRRSDVIESMRFYVFGHSIYEKALQPYKGITAKTVIFDLPPRELERPLPQQIATLDARLAKYFGDPKALSATETLAPLPVLGIPGWTADNEDERYYDDNRYFRPGRTQAEEEPDVRARRGETEAPRRKSRKK
ncbi:MAG: DUF3025 domain-containing protein [Pseudomonadota bacterium]